MAVAKLLATWLKYRSEIFGRPVAGTCPHDPLTVAEAVLPDMFVRYACGRIAVQQDGSTMFCTEIDGPHRVGIAVDQTTFLEWMAARLLHEEP